MQAESCHFRKTCTILINSCDYYEEAWTPFFFLFRKYWIDCPFEIVLNTETKKYNQYGVWTVNAQGSWTDRLADALNKIETPYVLFFLEDFFLNEPVKEDLFKECLKYMDENDSVGCIYFKNIRGCHSENTSMLNGFRQMVPTLDDSDYILNCQTGLWRKSVLQQILRNLPNGSAWDFEINGYAVNKDLLDKYKFYCSIFSYVDEQSDRDIFPYRTQSKDGIGITRSCWLWNNKRFFKNEGYNLEYKNLKKMSRFRFNYIITYAPLLRRVSQAIKRRIIKYTPFIKNNV